MLSPFQIRNLRPSQQKATQDSLVRISAPGYDRTISNNPSARLMYQDEGDGALITVGSSTELVQRLEEPVPQKSRQRLQSSRNPMSIATLLLSESQQSPPSLTHHVFDIEDRAEVRKLWQEIQARNNNAKPSANASTESSKCAESESEQSGRLAEVQEKLPSRDTTPGRLISEDSLDTREIVEAEKNNDFSRAYNRLRPTIWTPLARELGITWRDAEKLHWDLGEDALVGRASTEMLESFERTGPDFSDYRPLPFKSTMPPHLGQEETLENFKHHSASDQLQSSEGLTPTGANPAENLTSEGKRQAQAAGDKLRTRSMPSRHRKVATVIDHASHQNRWANYKSPSSGFVPNDATNTTQGYDGPSLTSEGKRQAQVAGDKLRNRTNPIRHSRPSRGSVSEHGINKNRWSTYGPRAARLDERRDSAESKDKLPYGDAELPESSGQSSLLELFEAELAKKMTANDQDSTATSSNSREPNTTGNLPLPAQMGAQQETNPLLDGLKLINDHLQGLTVGAEELPQEFPKALGQGFRAAIGGLSTFMRGVTNGLQEASTMTRQASERVREADVHVIDDTVLGLRNVAGEVTALGRGIIPELPKTNDNLKEDYSSSLPIPSQPPTIATKEAESVPSESKVTHPGRNNPGSNPQDFFTSRLKRPLSVAKSGNVPKPIIVRQEKSPRFVSDIPVSVTRGTRLDIRRLPRYTGMNRAPRYHKPGPIHLPHQSPLAPPSATVEAQESDPQSGYVDHFRRHQSTETIDKGVDESDNSQSADLPAAAARFPTLAQFEGQNVVSEKPFPPWPSMNMEPLVPLKPTSQSESRPADNASQKLSEDRAKNDTAASAVQILLEHDIDPGNLSEAQFQSFKEQNSAIQEKSIAVYAAHLSKIRQQDSSTKCNAVTDQESSAEPSGADPACIWSEPLPVIRTSGIALEDYNLQLKILREQNRKRLLMAREGLYRQDSNSLKSQSATPLNVQMSAYARLPPGQNWTNTRSPTLQEYQMGLTRFEDQSRTRPAMAQQEQEQAELLRTSDSLNVQSASPSDVQVLPGMPPNAPKVGGGGHTYPPDYHMQLARLEQQNQHKLLEAQQAMAHTSDSVQEPEPLHSKSSTGEESSRHGSLTPQALSETFSRAQKERQTRIEQVNRSGAADEAKTLDRRHTSQAKAQNAPPSTQPEVPARFVTKQSMGDESSAARLAEPFDPLDAEPFTRPHLTEGIRRNATIAGTDSRHNGRHRRPYSEAFDGNGRVEWDQFLRNATDPQSKAESLVKRRASSRESPVSDGRPLGSRLSPDDNDEVYYDLPSIGCPKWNESPRHIPQFASPPPAPKARHPYGSRSDSPARLDLPHSSSRSSALPPHLRSESGGQYIPPHLRSESSGRYIPPHLRSERAGQFLPPHIRFESAEQRRRIQSCVYQLQDLGFGKDGVNGAERLMQCAAAADGDLVEAIDMIDEDQRAYKEREAAVKSE